MLKTFQKQLRQQLTPAEKLLWHQLKNRRFYAYKFRRQHIIAGFIVDFICLKKKLIIELDGGQHVERIQYDNKRTAKLTSHGYKVIRFWNDEVINKLETVLGVIYDKLNN